MPACFDEWASEPTFAPERVAGPGSRRMLTTPPQPVAGESMGGPNSGGQRGRVQPAAPAYPARPARPRLPVRQRTSGVIRRREKSRPTGHERGAHNRYVCDCSEVPGGNARPFNTSIRLSVPRGKGRGPSGEFVADGLGLALFL